MIDALFLSFVTLLLGSIHFWNLYTLDNRFLMSDLCLWMTAATIGGGPILAYVSGADNLPGWEEMVWAYVAFFLYGIGLLLSRIPFRKTVLFLPHIVGPRRRSPLFYFISHIQAIPLKHILFCFAALILIKLYTVSLGGGVSGLNNLEVNLSRNYLIVIAEFLTVPFNTVITFFCVSCLFKRQYMKYVIPILIVILVLTMLTGRRGMIHLMVNALFVTIAFRGKLNIRHLFFSIAAIYAVFAIFSPLYLTFRSAAQSQMDLGKNTFEIVGQAISDLGESDKNDRKQNSDNNLKERSVSILGIVHAIEQAVEVQGPLLGAAFLQGQLCVLPRFARGGLETEGALNPKVYVQQQLGFLEGDATYSLTGEGVADFGIVGSLFEGILMGLFVNFGTLMALKFYPTLPLLGMSIFSNMWLVATDPEINPGFQATMIRDILLLTMAILFLRKIGIRMTHKNNSQLIR